MPIVSPSSGFGRSYQQTASNGVTVTASATPHSMGNYSTLIDPLSYDCFGLFVNVNTIGGSGVNTSSLMDIAVAPTGGGSEDVVIPYLDVGAAATLNQGGKAYFFPLYVPAGKAIRARMQATVVSDTAVVVAHAYELPPHGFAEDAPQQWTQYGANTGASRGTAVTSASGSFGTDVDITAGAGTTSAHRWFHVGLDFGTNTAISAGRYRVRLARDASAADIIGVWDFTVPSTAEVLQGPLNSFPVCCPVSSGSLLRADIEGAAAEALSVIVYAY